MFSSFAYYYQFVIGISFFLSQSKPKKCLLLYFHLRQVGLPMHCMCPTLSFSFSSSLSFSFFLFMSHLSFFLFMSHSLFLSLYVSFSLSFSLCLILSLSLSLPYGGKKFNLINAPPQLMLKKV